MFDLLGCKSKKFPRKRCKNGEKLVKTAKNEKVSEIWEFFFEKTATKFFKTPLKNLVITYEIKSLLNLDLKKCIQEMIEVSGRFIILRIQFTNMEEWLKKNQRKKNWFWEVTVCGPNELQYSFKIPSFSLFSPTRLSDFYIYRKLWDRKPFQIKDCLELKTEKNCETGKNSNKRLFQKSKN